MTDALTSPSITCPACRKGFVCGMAADAAQCWCYALPHPLPVPGSAMTHTSNNSPPTRCFCPTCLQVRLNGPPTNLNVALTALINSD